jgi:hypothetical protein
MTESFSDLYTSAKAAGLEAGAKALPAPMTLVGGVPGETPKVYFEPEGMCGFAWVNVRPGTSKFARWLKREGHARSDSYYGGVTIWVSEHGQSVERKEAHAKAMAEVFRAAGFNAHDMSRLD